MTFKNKVYKLVKKIPRGKVATYGQIAKLAGKPGAARAVGVLLKNNPYTGVPCHRVVGAKGELVGYSRGEGIKSKKQILENEGVFFKGGRVDLEKSVWKPKKMEERTFRPRTNRQFALKRKAESKTEKLKYSR